MIDVKAILTMLESMEEAMMRLSRLPLGTSMTGEGGGERVLASFTGNE